MKGWSIGLSNMCYFCVVISLSLFSAVFRVSNTKVGHCGVMVCAWNLYVNLSGTFLFMTSCLCDLIVRGPVIKGALKTD